MMNTQAALESDNPVRTMHPAELNPPGEAVVLPLPGIAGYLAANERELLEFLARALHDAKDEMTALVHRVPDAAKRRCLIDAMVIAEFVMHQSGIETDLATLPDGELTPIQKLAFFPYSAELTAKAS